MTRREVCVCAEEEMDVEYLVLPDVCCCLFGNGG